MADGRVPLHLDAFLADEWTTAGDDVADVAIPEVLRRYRELTGADLDDDCRRSRVRQHSWTTQLDTGHS
jgi:hypothetical protein